MVKKLKCIANIIPYLILLIAFILIISLVVDLRKGDTPSILGTAVFFVETDSMEDTLLDGDVIFVDTNYDLLRVGDIVTYNATGDLNNDGFPEMFVNTHRIVEITIVDDVAYYTTQGDNNDVIYDWETSIIEEDIIGVYQTKSTFIGWVYGIIKEGGMNLLFGVIVLVFIAIGAMEVVTIVRQISMQKQKEQLEKEKQRLVEVEVERLRKEMKEKEK